TPYGDQAPLRRLEPALDPFHFGSTVMIIGQHRSAREGQPLRDRCPETAARTDNDRNLSLEPWMWPDQPRGAGGGGIGPYERVEMYLRDPISTVRDPCGDLEKIEAVVVGVDTRVVLERELFDSANLRHRETVKERATPR